MEHAAFADNDEGILKFQPHGTDIWSLTAKLDGALSSPYGYYLPEFLPVVKQAEFDTFAIVGEKSALDQKRPTVAVLDHFDRIGLNPDHWKADSISHGDVSAAPAEQRGYNVIRLNIKMQEQYSENTPKAVASALKEIATKIENGTLTLGKGDVLNISLASPQLHTFDFTSRQLGLHVTAANLSSMVPQIVDAMKKYASNTANEPALRAQAKDAVEVYSAIQRIQSRGVEVVHAAGNSWFDSGADRFDWKFLGAQTELAATNDAGKVYDWSVHNSTTVSDVGDYELHYRRVNLWSPEPIERQVGTYQLGNLPVYFDARKFGGVPSTNIFRILENGQTSYVEHNVVPIPSELFSPQKSGVETSFLLPLPTARKFELMNRMKHVDGVVEYPYDKLPVDIAQGSSYANINYLWHRYDFLQQLKLKSIAQHSGEK
jgi:hypothetical protein